MHVRYCSRRFSVGDKGNSLRRAASRLAPGASWGVCTSRSNSSHCYRGHRWRLGLELGLHALAPLAYKLFASFLCIRPSRECQCWIVRFERHDDRVGPLTYVKLVQFSRARAELPRRIEVVVNYLFGLCHGFICGCKHPVVGAFAFIPVCAFPRLVEACRGSTAMQNARMD